MQVYLIRHTTPDIAKGVCYGQSDVPLNMALFQEEQQSIRNKIPAHVDQYYSSPLSRCSTLANTLSAHVIQDDLLKELHFGDWEMQPWNEIDEKPLNKWMADFVQERLPAGESYLDLHQRSTLFINRLLEQPHESVAIVSHAGNLRSILSLTLQLPLENSFRMNIKYGAVIHLTLHTDPQLNQVHL